MKGKLEQQLLLKALDKTEWRRDQRDAVGWQLVFEITKQNAIGQPLAETGEVTSLEELQGTALPMLGLPPSRRGIVHRRQNIDLQGTQRAATLSKRGQRQQEKQKFLRQE